MAAATAAASNSRKEALKIACLKNLKKKFKKKKEKRGKWWPKKKEKRTLAAFGEKLWLGPSLLHVCICLAGKSWATAERGGGTGYTEAKDMFHIVVSINITAMVNSCHTSKPLRLFFFFFSFFYSFCFSPSFYLLLFLLGKKLSGPLRFTWHLITLVKCPHQSQSTRQGNYWLIGMDFSVFLIFSLINSGIESAR